MIFLQAYNAEALNDFLWGSDFVDEYMVAYALKMTGVAGAIAVPAFFTNLAWNYLKATLTGGMSTGNFFSPADLTVAFSFLIILSSYVPIVTTVLSGISYINSATVLTDQDRDKYIAVIDTILSREDLQQIEAGVEDKGSVIGQVENFFLNAPTIFMDMVFMEVTRAVLAVISLVIGFIAKGVIAVLYIMGPLGIAVSILPWFREKIMEWLGTLLNVAFVFTTMNILDGVVILQMDTVMTCFQHSEIMSQGHILAMNISIIILYCMSFWLTSKFIGSDSAGRVLSTAVGAATSVASIMAGSPGGANMIAGQNNLAANVAQTGSKGFEQ